MTYESQKIAENSFTILRAGHWPGQWGFDNLVSLAPDDSLPDRFAARFALMEVVRYGRNHASQESAGTPPLFTYHFGANQDVEAVTFNDPQAIVLEPSIVLEDIPDLPLGATNHLAHYVAAVMATRDHPSGN